MTKLCLSGLLRQKTVKSHKNQLTFYLAVIQFTKSKHCWVDNDLKNDCIWTLCLLSAFGNITRQTGSSVVQSNVELNRDCFPERFWQSSHLYVLGECSKRELDKNSLSCASEWLLWCLTMPKMVSVWCEGCAWFPMILCFHSLIQ